MRLNHAMVACAAAAMIVGASRATAQTATQTVTYEVQAINQIVMNGSPSLTIMTAVAGSAPTSVTANASYALTTNQTNRKITANLNSAMEAGLTLNVSLQAPGGGASATAVDLSTTAQDVVTAVSTLNQAALSMTYTLSATSAAGVVPSSSKIVTYTITAGA